MHPYSSSQCRIPLLSMVHTYGKPAQGYGSITSATGENEVKMKVSAYVRLKACQDTRQSNSWTIKLTDLDYRLQKTGSKSLLSSAPKYASQIRHLLQHHWMAVKLHTVLCPSRWSLATQKNRTSKPAPQKGHNRRSFTAQTRIMQLSKAEVAFFKTLQSLMTNTSHLAHHNPTWMLYIVGCQ